jgi:hypothetical protein
MHTPGLVPLFAILVLAFLLFARRDQIPTGGFSKSWGAEDRQRLVRLLLRGACVCLTAWAAVLASQFFLPLSETG